MLKSEDLGCESGMCNVYQFVSMDKVKLMECFQVDVEKLASCLPLHLMACVASSGTEPRLRYWLRAVRLLHTLSTLALGYPKLSQVCSK